ETRLVGTALYVATQTWAKQGTNDVWEQGVTVSAFDFAQSDVPLVRPSLQLRGSGGVVTATDSHLFVATSDADRPWWTSTLHVFDIADPSGFVQPGTAIPLTGSVKDKFKIHQRGDVVAVVTEGWSETNQVWRSELVTYRLWPAEAEGPRWTRLGSLELGLRENLFATRFDGDRAYVVTYRRVDPLWVGWSTYIHPMGDRLLTVGVDDTAGRRVAVQLFDVADPAAPALRSKVVLGEGWSSSEALENEKALGIFPDDGLVLVPISMSRSNQYVQGVQFVDLAQDTLRIRGTFESVQMVTRRMLVRGDRVLAISNRELLTVDAANRDAPTLRHTLELGYPVDRVIPVGDWLVEFSGTEVRVSEATKPGVTVRQYALDDLPVLGAIVESNQIHVLQGRSAPGSGWTLLDPADGTIISRGLLKHVVLEAARLPDLTVAGTASTETTNQFWVSDAKPLWPRPGLLVWSVNGQQWSWWQRGWPVLDAWSLNGGVIQFAPMFAFWPSVSPNLLVAVDVNEAASPRFLSEMSLAGNASAVSDTIASDGLVFFSHARQESEIVSTNYLVYTNQIWVTATNHVWRTNFVSIPVTVTETNVLPPSPLDAVKLRWPGTVAGSRLAGGMTHNLGMNGNGIPLAWGDNLSGAAGPGQGAIVAGPSPVTLPNTVNGIAAGNWQSLALDADGVVWHWGSPEGAVPPLPWQPAPDFSNPESIPLPARASAIAAGGWHALALAPDSRLWAWGWNTHGQLGVGNTDALIGPQLVQSTGFVAIACGALHSLALDANGRVFSWGSSDFGQLGRTGPSESPAPTELPYGAGFRAIAAGAFHSVALTTDGTVWGWGDNQHGQIGPRGAGGGHGPGPVSGLPAAREIVAGWMHSLVLAENGEVWFLGEDSVASRQVVARVEPLKNVVALGAGLLHSLALTADGNVFVWGGNLSLVGGSGDAAHLSLMSETWIVSTHTHYVTVTNVVQEERISQQLQARVFTNALPVYRYWTRHSLDVVDYQQDPAAPALREPTSLPGVLQGVSHHGAVLYTLATNFRDQPGTGSTLELSALAYDGLAAYFVSTLTLSTNSNEDSALVAVNPNGVVVAARDSWTVGHPRRIECWRLDERGQFVLLGALDRATHSNSLLLLNDLATLRTETGFDLVDLARPTAPAALPVSENVSCLWADLGRVRGGREMGLWLPAGELGTLLLWRP
ncbi:MAG: hypothetical protein DME26_10895, partial [Verrucomicrobia bacterium]